MELLDQYRMIAEALRLLATSFEQQKQLLPEFADVPDDVISSFESTFLLLPSIVESGLLSKKIIASILRLYNKVQWCLRNVNLDDFSNKEWNEVRGLAKEALKQMGEPLMAPNS